MLAVMTAVDRGAALLLAVGLDALTLGRIKAAVHGTELLVQSVSAEAAVERAQNEEGPVIGLVEWTEEQDAQQTQLCDALRRAVSPGNWYIVAIGGLTDFALSRVLEMRAPSAWFLPKIRPHNEHLRVDAGKIPSLRRPAFARSVTPFPAPPPGSRRVLPLGEIAIAFNAASKTEGAVSVAILDREKGASLLLSGKEIDTGIAWSQLSLPAALGPTVEEVIGGLRRSRLRRATAPGGTHDSPVRRPRAVGDNPGTRSVDGRQARLRGRQLIKPRVIAALD